MWCYLCGKVLSTPLLTYPYRCNILYVRDDSVRPICHLLSVDTSVHNPPQKWTSPAPKHSTHYRTNQHIQSSMFQDYLPRLQQLKALKAEKQRAYQVSMTLIIVAIAVSSFLIAGRDQRNTLSAQHDWCVEQSYLDAPSTYQDMYLCNQLGVALDNIVNQ